jgi:hypothetical protein
MSYNKFKIKDLETKLNLSVLKKSWLPEKIPPYSEDNLLAQILMYADSESLISEKARSEFIIAPTLQAFRRRNMDKFSIFSGYEFNIDKTLDLSGYCDFILSLTVNKFTIDAPAFFVVETKKTDLDDNAIAQCGAEMYAAQLFNEREGKPQKVIYGCVTSGFSWGFLKLEQKMLAIDTNYVPLTFKNPYQVLAILQWLLDRTLQDL